MNARILASVGLSLAATLMLIGPSSALAQEAKPKKKGFDTSPAQRKAVTAAEVVPAETVRMVKRIEVGRNGIANSEKLTPKVETIELWSNGVMRWNFSIHNPRDMDVTSDLRFFECYVADSGGNRYGSVANDKDANQNADFRLMVQAGTKAKFWIEYEAPKEPTKSFRVGLPVNGNYGAPFPPFTVTLKEEIPEPVKEAAVEAEPADTPTAGKTAASTAARLKAAAATPTALDRLSVAMKSTGTGGGVSFEGNARMKSGSNGPVRIAFEAIPGDGTALKAKLSSTRFPEFKGTLTGRILEDADASGGLAMVLIGPDGTTYKLSVKDKMLKGTDSNGGSYTLLAK